MKTVFIDGQSGTTGLKIRERLAGRTEIEPLRIPEAQRKDPEARRRFLNRADFVILCLPDDAARESVALIENPAVRVLDASSAHRTSEGWVYGIPEMSVEHRARIASAKRVSNPGCYPTGFILALRPLVAAVLVPADYPIATYAITGYSGGGRAMIEDYRGAPDQAEIAARPKNLALSHKHLPEMSAYALIERPPVFIPIVANVLQGMLVFVPLDGRRCPPTLTPPSCAAAWPSTTGTSASCASPHARRARPSATASSPPRAATTPTTSSSSSSGRRTASCSSCAASAGT
jgi:N-acetyl-gamma-glutamyl-phosphate reductase